MEYKAILNDRENQKYFVWTPGGLRLSPDAPPDVALAWQEVSGTGQPRRKARLNLLRRAQGILNNFLG